MDPVCMGAAAARVLEMRAEVRAACGRSDLRGQHQRPEPASLTRILVEAESTGTPFVLVCNMVELVDDELVAVGRLAASVVSVPSLNQVCN
ncbi:unnamed protein product [Urochloa humidicola]